MSKTEDAAPAEEPVSWKAQGRIQGLLDKLFRDMQSLALFQPNILIAKGTELDKELQRKRYRRQDASEAQYVARHKSILKSSAQEQVMSIVGFFTRLFFSLPFLFQILMLILLLFALLIFLPAILGVILTVQESRSELVRLVTIACMFFSSLLALTLVKI
jgi:hypothetical protein